MHTSYKRFKLRVIYPIVIRLQNLIFGKRARSNNVKNYNDPFFIIGSGRNGSTLLGGMLNTNNNVFIPPEQYVLGYSLLKWNLKRYKKWEAISSEIINDFQIDKNTCNWNTSLEAFKADVKTTSEEKRNFSNLIGGIFNFYALSKNKTFTIYGDQSPITTHFSKSLIKEFSESKFIILIRDPRDVVLSYSKIKDHPARNMSHALWKWNDSIETYDYLKKLNSGNILSIKYEDLVSNPKDSLILVCDFLNIQYNEQMLDTSKSAENLGVKKLNIHANLSKKINTSAVGKWKKELNENQINKINNLTKTNRLRFGYDD